MDITFLSEYSIPVIIGICLCAGYIIKTLVESNRVNKYIPLGMAILGTFISIWISDWLITPNIILSGMFSGLASTGLHQVFKQLISKE